MSLNGVTLTGVESVEVTNASHFTADTYRVTLSSTGVQPIYGPAYWGSSQGDRVAISVGFDGSPLRQIILGQVDDSEYDPVAREIILTGRDLSSLFLDSETREKYQNLTSSQIAIQLAVSHGLQYQVTETGLKAGDYYNIDHVVLRNKETEWDVLVYLAQHEGFDVWVSGTTLYFQPSPATNSVPYRITWSEPPASDATSLKLSRSQTLARDIIVIVESFNQASQKTITTKAHRQQAFKAQQHGGQAQTYYVKRPNLSQAQAQQLANSTAEELTRHERRLSASLPGDNLLGTRTMVQLVGTGTAWDQLYYPESVTRRLSVREGYRMELRAKNHSTLSDVSL